MERRRQYNIETNLSLGGFNYYFLINVMSKEAETDKEMKKRGKEMRIGQRKAMR